MIKDRQWEPAEDSLLQLSGPGPGQGWLQQDCRQGPHSCLLVSRGFTLPMCERSTKNAPRYLPVRPLGSCFSLVETIRQALDNWPANTNGHRGHGQACESGTEEGCSQQRRMACKDNTLSCGNCLLSVLFPGSSKDGPGPLVSGTAPAPRGSQSPVAVTGFSSP